MKGSYSLIIRAPEKAEIGAIGEKDFGGGYVVYNGSAFGSGGLKRVLRHFSSDKSIHWHIDYLLESGEIEAALIFPGEDLECVLSDEMSNPVEGFGSSDCDCPSHLFRFESFRSAFNQVSATVSEMKVMCSDRYDKYQEGEDEKSFEDFIGDLPGAEAYKESSDM